jgi:hypothetical protein
MTKIATAVNGETTTFETDELTGVHDRGVNEAGQPVVKIHRGNKPALFLIATKEAVTSAEPDITIDL